MVKYCKKVGLYELYSEDLPVVVFISKYSLSLARLNLPHFFQICGVGAYLNCKIYVNIFAFFCLSLISFTKKMALTAQLAWEMS